MRRRSGVARWLAWSAVGVGMMAAPARAATLTVTTTNDSGAGSLRQAITDANATAEADVVTFVADAHGTITLQSPLPEITKPIALQGPGAALLTINVNGTGRLLTFAKKTGSAVAHTVSGLTWRGGSENTTAVATTSGVLIWFGNMVTMEDCVLTDNHTAAAGGAVALAGGQLTLRRSTIHGNSAAGGAGIYAGSSSLTIEDSTFHHNLSSADGGAIHRLLGGSTTFTVERSTFYENTAAARGGAIFLDQSDLTLRNSTLHNNTATGRGGAIFFYNKSTTHLVSSTLVANGAGPDFTGTNGGGGLAFADQDPADPAATNDIQVHLWNSIVAHNTDTSGLAPDCAATLVLHGNNVVFTLAGCATQGDGVAVAGKDPALQATTALHGGKTLVFAPLAKSPVIDAGPVAGCTDEAGAPLATDQRGFARAFGVACDVGAVEQVCGDGQLFGGEVCDDGNVSNTDSCLSTCVPFACGDGFVGPGEACDDGNLISGDGCQANCALPTCGDGVVDPLETCDDGNAVVTDACLPTCVKAVCGDGFVLAGVEACDTGAANSNTVANACRTSCKAPTCGDGVPDAGEACDDGNAVNDDTCTSTCAVVPVVGATEPSVAPPDSAASTPAEPATSTEPVPADAAPEPAAPTEPTPTEAPPEIPAPSAPPAAPASGGCSLLPSIFRW